MSSLRVWGIELPLGRRSDEDLLVAVARALAIHRDLIRSVKVVRRSLDARKGRFAPRWVCTVDIEAEGRPQRQPKGVRIGSIPERPAPPSRPERRDLAGHKVAVVGTGPAGLFAALALGARGAEVTVLEQGASLKDRVSAVASLWRSGTLTGEANVQFGEGGAGTFSDGKLMTRVKDPLTREVLATFVECGAPEHILEEAHPHLGTDGVRSVVASLRQRIESDGATFRFRSPVTAVEATGDGVRLVTEGSDLRADVAFLAVGHSSRTLFRALGDAGVPFDSKGFAVGVRVEHPQAWVDQCQYGRYAGHPDLPAAEYFLTHQGRRERAGASTPSACVRADSW